MLIKHSSFILACFGTLLNVKTRQLASAFPPPKPLSNTVEILDRSFTSARVSSSNIDSRSRLPGLPMRRLWKRLSSRLPCPHRRAPAVSWTANRRRLASTPHPPGLGRASGGLQAPHSGARHQTHLLHCAPGQTGIRLATHAYAHAPLAMVVAGWPLRW
uniref:Secreted protein n=1 Tax=Mesocestoides corti TaxID=53468 RepID=A0A5K3FG16_MESCO